MVQLLDALEILGPPDEDPAAARLAVPVYLGDDEANSEWSSRFGDRLAMGRSVDRSVFVRTFAAGAKTVLDADEAVSLIRVLAELRLVVAARVGVEVEADYEDLGDEQAELLNVLGWLQHSLLEAVGV